MDKQIEPLSIEHQVQMLTLILSENQCHKCIRIAKEKNLRGGIVTMGKGTVKNTVLNLLGIKSQKKEVVNFLLDKETAKDVLDLFTTELELNKPGHGIAFTTPVLSANIHHKQQVTQEGMEVNGMFKKLTVVVDRGMAEDVMDVARKLGVRGGTIMHGRGAGADYTSTLFGVEIEPEKELVVMLTPSDLIDEVVDAIIKEFRLEEPGKGILFVEPILEARGLYVADQNNEDSN